MDKAVKIPGPDHPITIEAAEIGTILKTLSHTTYCPYKGDCSYYSIPSGGQKSANAVWSYESPYEAVASIKDHLAFYRDRVDSIETREA